jgi:hypothetical protein
MNLPAILERILWSAVAAGGGALVGVPLLGIEVWQAAGVAALGAVVNGVTQLARYRLSVLPDPGDGLPGLPT